MATPFTMMMLSIQLPDLDNLSTSPFASLGMWWNLTIIYFDLHHLQNVAQLVKDMGVSAWVRVSTIKCSKKKNKKGLNFIKDIKEMPSLLMPCLPMQCSSLNNLLLVLVHAHTLLLVSGLPWWQGFPPCLHPWSRLAPKWHDKSTIHILNYRC